MMVAHVVVQCVGVILLVVMSRCHPKARRSWCDMFHNNNGDYLQSMDMDALQFTLEAAPAKGCKLAVGRDKYLDLECDARHCGNTCESGMALQYGVV
jgi:hypothetical protein